MPLPHLEQPLCHACWHGRLRGFATGLMGGTRQQRSHALKPAGGFPGDGPLGRCCLDSHVRLHSLEACKRPRLACCLAALLHMTEPMWL